LSSFSSSSDLYLFRDSAMFEFLLFCQLNPLPPTYIIFLPNLF
jgi:hypothetical protein